LDVAPLCADRPVLHAQVQNRSAVRNIIGVCSSIFSKRRVARAGIAVLAALLAETGWTATKYFDRTTANPLVARRLNHE